MDKTFIFQSKSQGSMTKLVIDMFQRYLSRKLLKIQRHVSSKLQIKESFFLVGNGRH